MTYELRNTDFLDLLRRGTTIDIHAEHGDQGFAYATSTAIVGSDPDGDGGVILQLRATIEDGELWLPASVIATAEETEDCWQIRHAGLVFRFGPAS